MSLLAGWVINPNESAKLAGNNVRVDIMILWFGKQDPRKVALCLHGITCNVKAKLIFYPIILLTKTGIKG